MNIKTASAGTPALNTTEGRLLDALRHHLDGWRRKVAEDFGRDGYEAELAKLARDPVYSKFAFDCPEYVVVRLMGRMSISIGRRLGEIYDKLPRFVASARFNLSQEQVAEKLHGLELDLGIRYQYLSLSDQKHVAQVLGARGATGNEKGVGIEIRYIFNPNDSARLRKDDQMANYLQEEGLFPVYLIFSAISPRDEAIERLTRSGWNFLQGDDAAAFSSELFEADFMSILDRPDVRREVQTEVGSLMSSMFKAHAVSEVMANL